MPTDIPVKPITVSPHVLNLGTVAWKVNSLKAGQTMTVASTDRVSRFSTVSVSGMGGSAKTAYTTVTYAVVSGSTWNSPYEVTISDAKGTTTETGYLVIDTIGTMEPPPPDTGEGKKDKKTDDV